MRNKDFWKGFVSALVTAAVIGVGGSFLMERGVIPWNFLPGEALQRNAKTKQILHYLERDYVDGFDKELAQEVMYTGLAAGAGDPYTTYLTKESMESQTERNSGHFVGIGVDVMQNSDGKVEIVNVISGGSAKEAGLQSGDLILAVDGKEMGEQELSQMVSQIKGEAGTSVVLTIYRKDTEKTWDAEILRKDIQIETVEYEMLEDGIGYIALHAFRENTAEQFQNALEELKKQDMKGILLDLRNNAGGLVPAAYAIGEEILPEGIMVYTMDKEGRRNDLVCDAAYLNLPMTVLVNGQSASASEILAGAIQDTGRGELVGTKTFGKGLIQRLYQLPDGSGLNVTIQKYYTPKGTSIHGVGLEPDYLVELPEKWKDSIEIPREEDVQMQKGISILQKKIE